MSTVERDYTLPIAAITVSDRFRKDLGTLGDLQASIAEVGLLHPIVVTDDGTLLAGARRLAACQQLGWIEIPARIVNSLNSAATRLIAERDENTCRLDMKPSEKVALGLALEKLERPRAAQRQGTRNDLRL